MQAISMGYAVVVCIRALHYADAQLSHMNYELDNVGLACSTEFPHTHKHIEMSHHKM